MAEPFSIATGIAGLISLTIEITKITHAYVHEVKNASNKARELDQTLAALTQVLQQLETLLMKQNVEGPIFKETSVLFLNYDVCRTTLKKIRSKFEPTLRPRLASLIWPFTEKEHQQSVAHIHQWMQVFHYALDVEA